jgi:hypothetical protein
VVAVVTMPTPSLSTGMVVSPATIAVVATVLAAAVIAGVPPPSVPKARYQLDRRPTRAGAPRARYAASPNATHGL